MQADAGTAACSTCPDPWLWRGSHKLVASSAPVNGDKEMKGSYALSRPSRTAASSGRIDPAEFSFADYEAKDYLRVDLVASG